MFKFEIKNLLTYKYGGFICDKKKCFACGTLGKNIESQNKDIDNVDNVVLLSVTRYVRVVPVIR